MFIRPANTIDASAICGIYNPYIRETVITFEEQEVSLAEIRARMAQVTKALPWLVAEVDDRPVGYAYAAPWKSRPAYRYSVETTIYLDPRHHRRGLGRKLYGELITRLRERGIRRAIGGIALPNAASVGLHEALGFRQVAQFEQVGYKFDRWIDVGYWQLDL